MENPFEIINQRLERIESLLKSLNSISRNNNVNLPEIMNINELMSYLKVSKQYIYKLTSSREIPHSKIGNKLYFNKKDVITWISNHKVLTHLEIENEVDVLLSSKRN